MNSARLLSVFGLEWTRLRRGKKLRLGLVACGLVIAATITARALSDAESATDLLESALGSGVFTLLVYLVPFLFSSGAIAEEVDSQTFTYLTVHPVSRLELSLGKFTAGAVLSLGLLMGTILLMHVICLVLTPREMIDGILPTLRTLGACALLLVAYNAICFFWGALATEAAGIVSALYLGVMEFTFSLAPSIFRLLSLNHHASMLAGLPKGGFMADSVPELPGAVSASILAIAFFFFLLLGVAVVRFSEYRYGKA